MFATATAFVNVIYRYANIFSAGMKKKLVFTLLGNNLSENVTFDHCF